MFRPIARLAALLVLIAGAAAAQSDRWPAYENIFVNDYAGIVAPEAEARLRTALEALRAETGVEMTVLTIATRADYVEGETIEGFATTLFNIWGVGDATRNDGILVLVARDDREMRIALGKGYDHAWDRVAQEVIDDSFLPYFREERYSEGIETGSAATIGRIARPHAAGQPPPENSLGEKALGLAPLAFIAAVFGLVFRRVFADLGQRLRRCPKCGHRGLRRRRDILRAATRQASGQGMRITYCPNCDYRDTRPYTISRKSSSSSSSFGGGSSSGGGASGRW